MLINKKSFPRLHFIFYILSFCVVQCDVWPQVKVNGEYTGLELEIELPPVDESR